MVVEEEYVRFYKILTRQAEREENFEDLGVDGWIILIRVEEMKFEDLEWIRLAQEKAH